MTMYEKPHKQSRVQAMLIVASALLFVGSTTVPVPKGGDTFYLPVPLERSAYDYWLTRDKGNVTTDACEEMVVVRIKKEKGTFWALRREDVKERTLDRLRREIGGRKANFHRNLHCFAGPGWTDWMAKTKDDCEKMSRREDLPKPFRDILCFRIVEREKEPSED